MKTHFSRYLFLGLVLSASAMTIIPSCSKGGNGGNKKPAIPRDGNIEMEVEKTLKTMSIEEKVGQMVQLNISTILDSTQESIDTAKLTQAIKTYKIGSFLNVVHDFAHSTAYTARIVSQIQDESMKILGIPAIYGLDMIHGASYLAEGSLFPQEINLAATFNREFPADMGKATAYETRAAMVPWVFSPVMDLGRDARWPRLWESYGEDPYLQAEMSRSETLADQGEDPNHIDLNHVAACVKHFMAYGVPVTGKDRTPAYVPYNELREKFFEPFKECIEAGALSLMVNSASINGIPTHANRELLTGWVKKGLNWDGMIVTDWADVDNLYRREHTSVDKKDALAQAVNAGIDMIMDPYDPRCTAVLQEAVAENLIPVSRIDDAVRRILRLKYRLGLFDNPTWDVSGYERGRQEYKDQSLAAALESEVLLKNDDNILPIRKGSRILVTGPNANSMRCLNGGWSYTWQGSRTDSLTQGFNTIYEALKLKFGADAVDYVSGVSYDDNASWEVEKDPQIPQAVAAARSADVIVACIGENSYCETVGNVNDLNLSENQKNLIKALAQTGKPIVLILNEGRPRIIGDIEPLAKAVVDIFLPSNYGADALAQLLSGEANFSGKMPLTYPKYINSLHTYDYKVSENVSTMSGAYDYDAKMDVQWPFGYGMSYTIYSYSDFKLVSPVHAQAKVDNEPASSDPAASAASEKLPEFGPDDELVFTVSVRNSGQMEGKESILLFSSDVTASMVPDNRRLRAFEKVSLAPGETKIVTLKVPANDLAFVGTDGKWRLEKGEFRIAVGHQYIRLNCTATKVWKTQNID